MFVDEETQKSRLVLVVWDNDRFARTPLGYCYVDFYDCYFGRTRQKITSFSSGGRTVERYVYNPKETALMTPFATDGSEHKTFHR